MFCLNSLMTFWHTCGKVGNRSICQTGSNRLLQRMYISSLLQSAIFLKWALNNFLNKNYNTSIDILKYVLNMKIMLCLGTYWFKRFCFFYTELHWPSKKFKCCKRRRMAGVCVLDVSISQNGITGKINRLA